MSGQRQEARACATHSATRLQGAKAAAQPAQQLQPARARLHDARGRGTREGTEAAQRRARRVCAAPLFRAAPELSSGAHAGAGDPRQSHCAAGPRGCSSARGRPARRRTDTSSAHSDMGGNTHTKAAVRSKAAARLAPGFATTRLRPIGQTKRERAGFIEAAYTDRKVARACKEGYDRRSWRVKADSACLQYAPRAGACYPRRVLLRFGGAASASGASDATAAALGARRLRPAAAAPPAEVAVTAASRSSVGAA